MKIYKYKMLSSLQTFNLEESLEKLGQEGWEAVSMCAIYPKTTNRESAKTQELVVLLKKYEKDMFSS